MSSVLPPGDSASALSGIFARIDAARKQAVSPAPHTHLIAVTKTYDAASIQPVLDAGHRLFGENRVQEAAGKWPALRERHPDIRLHMIGPLQTNKVRDAVALFDAIHTVDRAKLAEAIAKEIERAGHAPMLFIQVNTGEEAQKAGVAPQDTASFIALCRDSIGLSIAGLLCIPPADQPSAPHFALLQKIARDNGVSELSMGMSGDFETAIKFGASYVRVGSAIFGARAPSP